MRGFIVRAYDLGNLSFGPVEKILNEISVLNTTLTGLRPFTFYDVRIAAFTNGGVGESPGVRILTMESSNVLFRLFEDTDTAIVYNSLFILIMFVLFIIEDLTAGKCV